MKILIAEDDPASNLLLKSMLLRWGFDVVPTFNGADAWKILEGEDPPQIAIIDWILPGIEGLEVCRRIRETEKGGDRYTYVVILTGRDDKEDIVAGIGAGADDYIIKPFDKDELKARLNAGQRIIELQTALRIANRKLLSMSRLDPLTGALSRSAIIEDLDLAMYRSAREKKSLSISLVDIDDLKELNERCGRGAGDRILQTSVRRINACLRRTDNFGRYGKDEFLVILPGVDLDNGRAICQRIQNAVNDDSFPVTVSQSLAVWDGKASSEEFIALAERTLLTTKTDGCNRVVSTGPGQ
ncbi:MAG: GGDEF domain-containing response regulator [Syntrophales bacterium]